MECAEDGLRPGEAEATAAPSNALDPRRPGSGGPGCPGLASSGWGSGARGTEVFCEPTGRARPRTLLFKRLGGPHIVFLIPILF